MRLSASIVLFALLAVFVAAQPSPYFFIAQCPEGCRDVDKIQSCGSVAAVSYCNMAVNGDVQLNCNDGNQYFLGQFGCAWNTTGDGGIPGYFFDHSDTALHWIRVTYIDYEQYFAPALIVLAAFVTFAGYKLLKITLTLFAFIWEFFFAFYILIIAGSTPDMSMYFALGLGGLVALLCLWRGPMFGRAIVGLSIGTLVGVTALTIAQVDMGYTATFVVIGLDIVAIVFAYTFKRSSLIALFGISVFVMLITAIPSLAHCNLLSVSTDMRTLATVLVPAVIAGIVCVGVNIMWAKMKEKKKQVNQRFQHFSRHDQQSAMMQQDVSLANYGTA